MTKRAKNASGVSPETTVGRGRAGWLSTRARTDLAHVTVYSLHVLQKRIQGVIRRFKAGHQPTLDEWQGVRESMLALWHDAHRHTPRGVPLSYEDYQEQTGRAR
jgi:hypothetical protein